MTQAVWHASWSGMKGVFRGQKRPWMTWGEFAEALRIYGCRVNRYEVWQLIAADPPEKVSGIYRYEVKHLEIVRKHLAGKEADGLGL